jgi:hypothetical protein
MSTFKMAVAMQTKAVMMAAEDKFLAVNSLEGRDITTPYSEVIS